MKKETVHLENCDLCVIGMGVSGLNALSSSSEYLSKSDRIIIVDKQKPNQAIGGMWNNVYQFVRLHQPHPLFTVGDKKWRLKKNASHLASKPEILNHFNSCYQQLKNKFSITEMFGYEYLEHEEVKEGADYVVHVKFKSAASELPDLIVKAKRCIKSFGFNVRPNTPMQFSTDKVYSLSPESEAMHNGTVANDNKPVFIIGGGKTSMDAANYILSQNPDRKITFIVGKGSFFLNRDTFFPAGIRKNWHGVTITECLKDIAYRYDENNLKQTTEDIKSKYALSPFPEARQTLIGVLSPDEAARVEGAMQETIYDYLVDAKEEGDEVVLHFKSGLQEKISQGSWLINCSGHLFLEKKERTDPILSEKGKVLSIQATASAFVFTSFAGYFLPHLWFRNQFQKVPLLQFNHQELVKKDKESYLYAFAAQVIHNQIRCVEALPLSVINKCGLNFDKWFPLHRQLPVVLNLLTKKKRHLRKTQETIQKVCDRYGVEVGVIGQS
ncbi:MAG: hypothetical protein AAFQ94_25505 [Bacteroidota bacterium]